MNKTIYVGLDVHKDTIAVAVADEGRVGEIRFFGSLRPSCIGVGVRQAKTSTT